MAFTKPLKDVILPDIEQLKFKKICESQIFDYKEQILEDNKFLKEVSAFANTQGGFLIFGIKESGKGGYPEGIIGIDLIKFNKERMEQLILGNIQPRINVNFKIIDLVDSSKAIVCVQIPNSYLKPHMNNLDKKFYKRFQFEAIPMTEIEVSYAYRERYRGYQEVNNYVDNILERLDPVRQEILGQIIIIPTILENMIITHNIQDFDWINKINFELKFYDHTYIRSIPKPSPNGIKCQFQNEMTKLDVHRNGCVYYSHNYGDIIGDKKTFLYHFFILKLLNTLQFSSLLYQRYNYFGDVKLICDIHWTKHSWLPSLNFIRILENNPCQTNLISISREFPVNMINSNYEYITSGIMDDIFNSYGIWKCPFFDEEGKLKDNLWKSL